MAPIIGVTPCRSLPDYLESVRRAGGEPRVLDPTREQAAEVAGSIDGLLLTGGTDVDPRLYGDAPHATLLNVEPERDDFEIAIVHAARKARRPVFGICRGLQIVNVALGGTLIQDIPSELPGSLEHSVPTPQNAVAHEIWVTRGSLLYSLMQEKLAESDACDVNSRHHQSIKRVAAGFEITATAPDGVVEAIECGRGTFCLGVQWHPENFWRTGEFRPLFEGFVEACRKQ
jgi:putative glutamine amidotransferase